MHSSVYFGSAAFNTYTGLEKVQRTSLKADLYGCDSNACGLPVPGTGAAKSWPCRGQSQVIAARSWVLAAGNGETSQFFAV